MLWPSSHLHRSISVPPTTPYLLSVQFVLYYYRMTPSCVLFCSHKDGHVTIHTVLSFPHTCLSVLSLGSRPGAGSRDPGCEDKVTARTLHSLEVKAEPLPAQTAGVQAKLLKIFINTLGFNAAVTTSSFLFNIACVAKHKR